jgi:mannose-1-phosphate guanylyltransferase/mannose-6-phosphate isomerase
LSSGVRIAVVMAGGSGRRFWPLSREARPKQVIPLIEGKSLLGLTIERLLPLFRPERIWVITADKQAKAVGRIAARYGAVKILREPVGKNTAPCIAYGATVARAAVGEASLVFLPADHLIRNGRRFLAVIKAGLDFAEREDALVTLGISPTRPATGFGYIRRGTLAARVGGMGVYRVRSFAEKPTLAVARRYLTSGDRLWNSGIFIFRSSVILDEIAEHLPAVGRRFGGLAGHIGRRTENAAKEGCYRRVSAISLDVGVLEKTRRAFVVPADIGWDDLGSWESFSRYMKQDRNGNRVHGQHAGIDSRRCVIYAEDRLVATIGIEDMVVVVTDDAVLVAKRDGTESVRDLAALLEVRGLGHLL